MIFDKARPPFQKVGEEDDACLTGILILSAIKARQSVKPAATSITILKCPSQIFGDATVLFLLLPNKVSHGSIQYHCCWSALLQVMQKNDLVWLDSFP